MANHFEVDVALVDTSTSSGIDEVGRGCLAGPVVVASVTWNHERAAQQPWFVQLADSKKLDPHRRARLFPLILNQASRARVAIISNMLIDELNILMASLHGFELVAPGYDAMTPLFIDGNKKPKSLPWAQTLVGGDGRQSAIAAASILAKVTRDGIMVRLAQHYPNFGFEQHMGYGTPQHRAALASFGATPIHRKSFAPVANACHEPMPEDDLWLHRIEKSEEAELVQAWHEFAAAYARLSLSGARRVLGAFQRRGLRVLPSPRDHI